MAMVVTFGGPLEYANQVWDDVEPDADGYVLILGGAGAGPEAWYFVDVESETIPTEQGDALAAEYAGERKPGT
ncbi:hypothetical protein [Mumia sp. Pv 4-285]|uniref:hypothetical protein n=1 Tax=Mumia qirimensis TaxID=3234852 RepID=UPI00351D529E